MSGFVAARLRRGPKRLPFLDARMSTATGDFRSERELIRRIGRELGVSANAAPSGALGSAPVIRFGDDMAQVALDSPTLIWTTDMLMDGTDFKSAEHGWRAIGRKAMAVNLSDCAAMAVVPVAALCAVSLNNVMTMDDALELFRGARDCGLQFACPIVGGDTNSWDSPTVICISLAARPDATAAPVGRDGARPGDRIYLTGPVGGSILGRHMTFDPRIEPALAIAREFHPHAMIDISDGLAIDLGRILELSGCGAELDEAGVKAAIHDDAARLFDRDGVSPLEHALHDGEDFELVVVLPPAANSETARRLGLIPIGRIVPDGFDLIHDDGRRSVIEPRGWEHFR